jgi:hypothetical protein
VKFKGHRIIGLLEPMSTANSASAVHIKPTTFNLIAQGVLAWDLNQKGKAFIKIYIKNSLGRR